MQQLHNGNHHYRRIKQQTYTSNNRRKQKRQLLSIKATGALKQILNLKQVYLTHTLRSMILAEDYMYGFVIVLYVEEKINLIYIIVQK